MIRKLTDTDRQTIFGIANRIMPIDNVLLTPLTNKMTAHALAPEEILFSAGETNDNEYFVLEGLLRTFVISHEGKDVTLGFYRGPGVLSPSITRSHDGKSRVHCEAIAQSVAVGFPFASLVDLMQRNDDIRLWVIRFYAMICWSVCSVSGHWQPCPVRSG